jgi:hypothetical protein
MENLFDFFDFQDARLKKLGNPFEELQDLNSYNKCITFVGSNRSTPFGVKQDLGVE